MILLLLLAATCSTRTPAPNKFSDPVIRTIYDLKDRRATDSLLIFLKSGNPAYRSDAALALGSVQDSVAAGELGNILLEDPDAGARMNAAFALGQTICIQSVNALIPSLADKDRSVVREVLEALGKTVVGNDLATLSAFHSEDTLLQEGLAWGFYQLALRKKADSAITRKMSKFLIADNSYQTRLAASHYFGRSQKVEGKGFEQNLITAALQDVRPEVRMAAVNGFRHLSISTAKIPLTKIFKADSDYRVRVNAVRVCQNFPLDEMQEIVFGALHDSLTILQITASEVIRNLADRYPLKRIPEDLASVNQERAKGNLYAALLKSIPPDGTVREIIQHYAGASNYFKAGLLSAMGEARWPLEQEAFKFLSSELLLASNEKVVSTAAAASVVFLNTHLNVKIPAAEFLKLYEQAIALGDIAVIGIVASALADENLHYKEHIRNLDFLYKAREKFSLPRDIESMQPLEDAIAYLEGKEKPVRLKTVFNHPIDWAKVMSLPVGQRVLITTTRGDIVIRLLVEEAPGSAANFAQLVEKGFFNGKYFHRVVPNFVIQGGCNRGDGYGSEDFSIRSEFPRRRYTTGSVGMASAGKDTEGTQWFITHSPTPHLDGRYSLFAETEMGLLTVLRIEVGDRIIEAKLVNEFNSK